MSGIPRRTATCLVCGLECRTPVPEPARLRCARCGAALRFRKSGGLSRSAALLVSAAILYVPANMLPLLHLHVLGRGEADTILVGIKQLFLSGMWEVGVVVFFASILIPVLKIVVLGGLLIGVWQRSPGDPLARTRRYRLIEGIGRWSMIDVFVVSLMMSLVAFGSIASIEPGAGATCFAAVVVLTILAVRSFEPRDLWDAMEET
ncbi:MAG: paraquat-inducible protein A [Myxococcota bacterium]